MNRGIILLIGWLSLAVLLCFSSSRSMAQSCQVVASRPEIQLGKQRHAANVATLFTQQDVTVVVECVGDEPIALLVDGTPHEDGQHFRFGAMGRMALSLMAAQYDGVDTRLSLTSAQGGSVCYLPARR
ncbi:hypothetical protein ACQKDS_09625 [Serratia sp. NPDC078593]|uniref:hypothetical protein n=1 Tax=unclassified Serratia (in: enterobacteria) TaxID=2647522 RepID=UPI0037D2D842